MNGDPAAAAGALDRPITVTIFPSISGAVKNEVTLSLRDLASQIPLTVAPAKENLKLIKLGRFGNVRSRKGSLRHDDNLIELCGVEGDYDGEVMPPAEMAEALERAGIAALVYTTPSYASDKLRWRVLAPFAQPQPPTFRGTAMSRLQGLIAHDFGRESWGCSQSFFIGHVQGAPPPQVWLIEGTRCIDQADDLDRTARGKPAAKSECKGNGSVPDDGQAGFVFDVGSVDVSAELDAIAIGRGSHDALVRLAGFWAGQGMNAENIAASLQTALLRRPELRNTLDRISAANGFSNRFLFFLVRRANVLPFGGELDDLAIGILGARLGTRLEAARQIDRVVMNDEARTLWSDLYAELSAEQPGLLGATIARAEAQVVRLSLLYSLLDAQMVILPEHLRAALALWNYAAHSARRIFGDMQGDPVADGILTALRNAGAVGMTRNEMLNLFGRNLHSHHIARALTTLEHLGMTRRVAAPPGAGRPPEIWRAV